MINPFTIQAKISRLQQEVLQPIYTMHAGQESMSHEWLLVLTGRVIENHRNFLEELAESSLVAAVFKIVKLLGGARSLSENDFARFTSYVKDGGIKAMVTMLLAAEKEKIFLQELKRLPQQIRDNAPHMLNRSAILHEEFISCFFQMHYGSLHSTPDKLVENFHASTRFIRRLASLAIDEVHRKST